MKLGPSETELAGNWVLSSGGVSADEVEGRIDWLINNHLIKIAVSPQSGAWETLFRDPTDGRYWELTFPKGEMHGGGPKRLAHIEATEALSKYVPLNSN